MGKFRLHYYYYLLGCKFVKHLKVIFTQIAWVICRWGVGFYFIFKVLKI